AAGNCFRNAQMLFFGHFDFTYVEGFTCWGTVGPVEHAWCVDANGKVIETTWKEIGSAYFGIPVGRAELMKVNTEENVHRMVRDIFSFDPDHVRSPGGNISKKTGP